MGASMGNPAISPPIIIFVIITKYIPYIITPNAHNITTNIDILVKMRAIPRVKATATQTIKIPIKAFQFSLHRNAQIVRTIEIATVAAIAMGTTGSSRLSTTAEQQKLMMYEKEITKRKSRIESRGGLPAFLTQQAMMATTMIRTIGRTMTHALSN